GEAGHLKGAELLQGVRELAVAEFGPLSRNVLNNWGLLRGEDVGEIVYNLIDAGLMTKTEEDRKEDFGGIMDFGDSLDAEATW
ncbi:MAG TPA: Minf_1886 family protein, partial [Candidatus Eisenbacteria bacterium]|nr:Minf_1886 family protein [Candidatus Eisenbacteria bacterium]